MPAEKNLHALKEIMLDLPDNVCLAFVGDGPSRPSLEQHFKGMKVVFMVRYPFHCASVSPCVLETHLLVSIAMLRFSGSSSRIVLD